MLNYNDIATHLDAGKTAAEIAAILQADNRTVRDVDLGELLYMLNFRGILVRRIRPADSGEKWDGSIPAMIAAANDNGPPQLAVAVNQWFSHITNDRNSKFQTTNADFANLFAAIVATFADTPGMPSSADFAAVLALGGGLKFAGVTESDVQACIDNHAADAWWQARQAVVADGLHARTITTAAQIQTIMGVD